MSGCVLSRFALMEPFQNEIINKNFQGRIEPSILPPSIPFGYTHDYYRIQRINERIILF